MSNQIGWEEALEAFYGTQVSDKQVPVWEHYLKAENTNSPELVAAIEMAAESDLKPAEWRVTVRDLRLWLRRYRAMKASERNAKEAEHRKSFFMSEWKEKLRRGADHSDFMTAVDKLPLPITARNDICRAVLEK